MKKYETIEKTNGYALNKNLYDYARPYVVFQNCGMFWQEVKSFAYLNSAKKFLQSMAKN